MNDNDKYKIISNEYADLLIEYNGNIGILESNPNYSYNLINDRLAILHIPVNEITENSIYQFGYASIPKCYGIMTFLQPENVKGFTLHQAPPETLTGKGVIIGIVDTGIVYTMNIFQYPDKTSKIISIWDQTIDNINDYPAGFYYGTEYTREQINAAINSDNPHNIVPSTDEIGEGTAMAGISSAFYDKEKKFAGDAVNTELVIVKLKPAKPYLKDFFGIPENAISYQENDFIMGVKYLLTIANRLNRPIVICTGIGSSQGSHTGNDIISNYLYAIGNLTGKAIIVPAGNEGNNNHHYYGEIIPPDYINLVELNVGTADKNFTMELWGYPSDLFIIDVYAPSGELIYNIDMGNNEKRNFVIEYASVKIYVDYILSEAYSREKLFVFRFKNMQEGVWKFRISTQNKLLSTFHIWLPINNFISQGTYFNNANAYTTICQPGNGLGIITASSYNPPQRALDPSASRGFNSLNMPKPDITAPGVNIMAHSLNSTIVPFSGTSIAAAHTAGIAAQYLEWGIINGYLPNINSTIIRYMITNSADRLATEIYPNADLGFGLID